MSFSPSDSPNHHLPAHRKRDGEASTVASYVPAVRGGPAPVGDNALSHKFLLWVFTQWWTIVIPSGLFLAAATAAAVIYFYIPTYQATALLMIEENGPFIAFSRDNVGQSQKYVETQLELLRSPVVLQPVLGRTEIGSLKELTASEDDVKYLRDHMSIRQVGKSELYNITYDSASPQAAADVVNAVVAEYMKIYSTDEFQRSQRVIDILEEERRRRGLEVERLRKRVLDLAKEVTGRDPFGSNEVTDFTRALSPVGALFQSLTEVEVEREVRKAEMQSFAESPVLAPDSIESSGALELEIESQVGVREHEQAIKDITTRMAAMKSAAEHIQKNPQMNANDAYVVLGKELNQHQNDIGELKAKLRNVILSQRKEKRKVEQSERLTKSQRDIESLDAKKESLSKRFNQQVKELQTGSAKSVELEFARAELEREEKVFELIASRKLALQTELRAPARVQLRQKAILPVIPIQPIPYKILLLACSAAFVAPFGLAIFRETTVRRVSDVEQLAQETGLRVLGEVASLPVRYLAVSPLQVAGRLRKDAFVFIESINSLRTNLALANELSGARVLAVSSSSPGEGKTSVAVSLAMSIANASGRPTLIIDGDMRSPSVASMLKTKSQPGLFDVLSNNTKVEDAIQRVDQSSLYVIPGGRATRSTHSVVALSQMKELLDQLRTRFSTIIIDTPPILGASEALVLAKSADSTLFCSLCDYSKSQQIRLAIERLEHAQVNVVGAVLSGTPARRYEYIYGYYANRVEGDGTAQG